ncbi:oxygenase [Promicromonospora citrea]|uniref:Oxygenase n=1 Tax=Promicromonospora citrea TaxID=43677 RepID=A0A8H9GHR2_9MICO|nr:FAD-dependent monooxygenase [Promicromonospora citrea]NNH54792.1 oxygenase [Promicromonospora citrea]GGM27782.1 oxygenase [Promicromonospora citrea]
MADTAETEVLVVGAGPTGLALACGLRLHGVGVRVVDRSPGPATTSRANFVHARGSEVLDRLGALGTLPDEAGRALQVTTYLGDRPMVRLRFGDPGLRTAAPPLVVSQARVEAELRERLAGLGVEPEWSRGLRTATQDDDGVTAELSDGTSVRAAWLVGCDGTRSTVRKVAGIAAPGVRLSERFLLADVHLGTAPGGPADPALDRTGTSGWAGPAGLLGLMPMPHPDGDLWRVLAYDPDGPADERLTPDEILRRVTALVPARAGRPIRVGTPEWLSEFTVHRRLADRYRAGRLLLAGDAAHAHAPFGGQGMLTGLGDAENLAWKLALVARGAAAPSLLDTYEAERRPLATDVLRGTSALTRVDVARSAAGRFLRDQVLVRAFRAGWVQRWATWTTSQLWVSYRTGPLGARPFTRRPRPGDRVADVPVRRPDGTTTRLYSELGGTWAYLRPAVPGARPRSAPAVLARLGGQVRVLDSTAPHRGTEAWLVRPDGHLAWRGTDADDLDRWLTAALTTGRRP